MKERQRQLLYLLALVLSLTVLAAPAVGADWFSFHVGGDGFGLSFGSTGWSAYGAAWHDARWAVSYDAALTGYGEWIWIDGLGRVWAPYVAAGWRPYTHGRWVVTPMGWTWVAYEPWGYFPHHFGHWAYTHHGWVWAPGYTYQPASVVWVTWGAYVGWYPLPPNGWSHAARGYRQGHRHGYDTGFARGYDHGWHDAQHATYVTWAHLGSHNVSRHAVTAPTVRSKVAGEVVRTSSTAPARSGLLRRGAAAVPSVATEQRTVLVGERRVTVTRPVGMSSSVGRHARETVERALSPRVLQKPTNSGMLRVRSSNASTSRTRITNGGAEYRLDNRTLGAEGNHSRTDRPVRQDAPANTPADRKLPGRTSDRDRNGSAQVSTQRHRSPETRFSTDRSNQTNDWQDLRERPPTAEQSNGHTPSNPRTIANTPRVSRAVPDRQTGKTTSTARRIERSIGFSARASAREQHDADAHTRNNRRNERSRTVFRSRTSGTERTRHR